MSVYIELLSNGLSAETWQMLLALLTLPGGPTPAETLTFTSFAPDGYTALGQVQTALNSDVLVADLQAQIDSAAVALSLDAPQARIVAEGTPQAAANEVLARKQEWSAYTVTQENITALLNDNTLKPGTTLKMRGPYSGDFVCALRGTASEPIVIDANGATLNGWLWLDDLGADVIVAGLDVGYLDWQTRSINELGANVPIPVSQPERQAIRLDMPGAQLRRLHIHDDRTGIGFWVPADGAAVDECHIEHNGWYNPVTPRFAGEGIYAQGETGQRIIRASVIHDNFDHNIALYSTNAVIENFTLSENVLFNDALQIGGHNPMRNVRLGNNLVYGAQPTYIGHIQTANEDVTLDGNTFSVAALKTGGYFQGLIILKVANLTLTNNLIVGNQNTFPLWVQHPPAAWTDWQVDDNHYRVIKNTWRDSGPYFHIEGYGDVVGDPAWEWRGLTWDQWRELTDWDANSTYEEVLPDDSVNVRLSAYANAATVTIWNWSEAVSQNVDFGALPQGSYRAFNAQNLSEYFDFEWAGEVISFAMTGWTNGTPIGHTGPLEPVSFPSFGVFLVEER